MLKIIEPTMQTKSDAKSKQSENCAEKTPSPCGPPICVTAIGTSTLQALKTIDGKLVFKLKHVNRIHIGISAANKPTRLITLVKSKRDRKARQYSCGFRQ